MNLSKQARFTEEEVKMAIRDYLRRFFPGLDEEKIHSIDLSDSGAIVHFEAKEL